MATLSAVSPSSVLTEEHSSIKEVSVVLIGKCGTGRTTLLNNLFHLSQDDGLSAEPITTKCESRDHYFEREGVKLVVTNTVGIPNGDKKDKEKLKKMFTHIILKSGKGMPHLLLFCISVDPACMFVSCNPTIMKMLHKTFGKDIWKRCKVIFTFSNKAWDQFKRTNKTSLPEAFRKYKDYLNDYARLFEEELNALGVKDVIVRTTFAGDQSLKRGQFKIVALPAGYVSEDEVFAGISSKDEVGYEKALPWSEVIYIEIAHSCNQELELALLSHKYNRKIALEIIGAIAGALTTGACGAAAGIAVGTAFGTLGGPIGAAIGGGIVGVIGGVAGLIKGGMLGRNIARNSNKKD